MVMIEAIVRDGRLAESRASRDSKRREVFSEELNLISSGNEICL
jgi:hypothetical protein